MKFAVVLGAAVAAVAAAASGAFASSATHEHGQRTCTIDFGGQAPGPLESDLLHRRGAPSRSMQHETASLLAKHGSAASGAAAYYYYTQDVATDCNIASLRFEGELLDEDEGPRDTLPSALSVSGLVVEELVSEDELEFENLAFVGRNAACVNDDGDVEVSRAGAELSPWHVDAETSSQLCIDFEQALKKVDLTLSSIGRQAPISRGNPHAADFFDNTDSEVRITLHRNGEQLGERFVDAQQSVVSVTVQSPAEFDSLCISTHEGAATVQPSERRDSICVETIVMHDCPSHVPCAGRNGNAPPPTESCDCMRSSNFDEGRKREIGSDDPSLVCKRTSTLTEACVAADSCQECDQNTEACVENMTQNDNIIVPDTFCCDFTVDGFAETVVDEQCDELADCCEDVELEPPAPEDRAEVLFASESVDCANSGANPSGTPCIDNGDEGVCSDNGSCET